MWGGGRLSAGAEHVWHTPPAVTPALTSASAQPWAVGLPRGASHGGAPVAAQAAEDTRGAVVAQNRHQHERGNAEWWVQGSVNGHAVPGNMRTLGTFRRRVIRRWRRPLRFRRQKTRLNWRRFKVLIQRWSPSQRLLHPFPRVRFDAVHPREERYVVGRHVRIWAGGAG
jgi:hypothetical protein